MDRGGLEKYLRDSFADNKPYDRLVHELVSATGTNRPGSPGFNGAVNFLCGKLDEDATQATAHTAKLFLGLQVQCTQCHNHPFNDWKQNQFWQLNSFFRQTAALRRFAPGTREVRFIELTDQDFARRRSAAGSRAGARSTTNCATASWKRLFLCSSMGHASNRAVWSRT